MVVSEDEAPSHSRRELVTIVELAFPLRAEARQTSGFAESPAPNFP